MLATQPISIPSADRSLDAFVATPEPTTRAGRHPAIVVIHEIFGPDAHIQDVARRFATLGYVAVAPDLFTGELHRLLTPENIGLAMKAFADAPPELRRDPAKLAAFAASQPPERRPILEAFGRINTPAAHETFGKELHAVAEYLRARPDVDGNRVGSVGFCFGGAMSARLATADPRLRAAVIFYGQNPPRELIPQIQARMLGLYGELDPGITSTVPDFAAAMKAAGKSFEYHVYPGAKHAFFNDTRPMYSRDSAVDAWNRVTQFFGSTLSA